VFQPSTAYTDLDEPAFLAAKSAVATQKERLSQDSIALLAQEVLHRLANSAELGRIKVTETSADKINAFCDVLLSDDEVAAFDCISQVRQDGAILDEVYLGYISGAARQLGERWDRDEISFLDVTIATGHLYAIMRGLRRAIVPLEASPSRHAFFAAVPGETHTIGLSVATDMFRQRGWIVDVEVDASHDQIIEALSQSNHTVIGLSASRVAMIDALVRLNVALRIAKPNAYILVSGQITEEEPEIVRIVDADCKANDMPTALALLENAVERRDAIGLSE
jgi:methanogenic corrinoid protein MtbC1